jgi:rubredoxin
VSDPLAQRHIGKYFIGQQRGGLGHSMMFTDLPEDFVCPDCAVRYKEDFVNFEAPQ